MEERKNFTKTIAFWSVLLGLVFIVAGVFYFRTQNSSLKEEVVEEKKIEKEIKVEKRFGIPIENYTIKEVKIKKNKFFSDLLMAKGVPYIRIDSLVKLGDSIFDVTRMKAGKRFFFFQTKDTSEIVHYAVYEDNAIDYFVFGLKDSLFVKHGQNEVEYRRTTAQGVIESSLWNSMAAQNLNPYLSIHLSEIFAWSIDFFGIQKQDNYQVIFEESFVNDSSIGIHKVLAARFENAGHDFFAFYFEKDSISDYFDDEGGSMRRTFLKAPLKYSRVSSRFTNSRYHPVLKIRRPHHGVDYAAPRGTPVHAIGDGKVIKRGWSGGGGRAVKIKHNGTYTTQYMHLSKYANIKVGDYVKQGQLIGYVGSSGLSTGPHLDFRFYVNGKAVDPLKVKSPPAEPLDSIYLDTFNLYVDKTKTELLNLIVKDSLKL
jgi:murein DD-endopeptidase MepM/ murein hydrolase activator NlpD